MKRLFVTLFFLFLLFVPVVFCSPQSEGFSYYVSISLDSDVVDEQLTDFPVLIHLSESCGINSFNANQIFEELENDYNGTAYVDSSGNRLYFEVEYWNYTEKEAFVWVKVPLINNVSDSVIYLWFDRFSDGSAYNSPADVWDNDFVGVWHMNDATTSTILDSTSNDNDGTKKGANEPIETDGKIGKGQDFTASADSDILVANEPNFDITDYITIEAWISKADWEAGEIYKTIFSKRYDAYEFRITSGKLLFQCNRGATSIKGRYNSLLSSGAHHIVFRFDKDTVNSYGEYHSLFLDGAPVPINWLDGFDINDPLTTNNYSPYIGSRTGSGLFADCIEDEIRVSNTGIAGRPDAWVGACYETQRDNLNIFGNIHWGNVASRGEFIAAALVASLILIPLLILIIFTVRRKR